MERRCVNIADEYAPPPTPAPSKPQRDSAGGGGAAIGAQPSAIFLLAIVGWLPLFDFVRRPGAAG